MFYLLNRIMGQAFSQRMSAAGKGSPAFDVPFVFNTGDVLSHLAKDLVPENDREHFLKIAKEEIAALHEGNFARYRLRPGEFKE